ncbi:hypothetical protein B0O99DRAFT_628935 [Bisporella sp. PMI_857]|nr:hypothetical protein B0O99DRAFT_628935 [Bisporella sp. PMI_857]
MDDALQKLLTFPAHPPPPQQLSNGQYDEAIKVHLTKVSRMTDKELLSHSAGGESGLDIIDPSKHSASYIFVLLAYIQAYNKGDKKAIEGDKLFDKIEIFLSVFDARQIRYVGQELAKVVDQLVRMAANADQRHRAIAPVRDVILRIDPSGSLLTSRHLLLVQLALESRHFEEAIPVLDKSILYFPGTPSQPKSKFLCDMELPSSSYMNSNLHQSGRLRYQDILEYFLWGGMVYIGLGRWKSALIYLESAITYPIRGNSVSRIMVEAYKKWVLVGLLVEGKLLPLPKSVDGNATKAFRIIGKPYESIANIFETGTAARLKSEAEHAQKIVSDDCNTGLVLQVLAAYQKFQIRNLANIYSKISIPEIRDLTTSAETGKQLPSVQAVKDLVTSMINDESLSATLTQPSSGPAVLVFKPAGSSLSEEEMQKSLLEASERIQSLTQQITLTDRMLTYDKEYIKYAQKQKKNIRNGATQDQGIGGSEMELDFGDEDLMATY